LRDECDGEGLHTAEYEAGQHKIAHGNAGQGGNRENSSCFQFLLL